MTLYTVEELASRLRVSRQFVASEIKKGRLRAYRLGRVYRISAGDAEDYLCRNTSLGCSKDDTSSHGGQTVSGDAIALRVPTSLPQRLKPRE